MGGLKLKPDVGLEDVDPADAAFFMLPGGDMWQEKSFPEIEALLQRLHEREILIGAICAATLEIVRAGLTQGIRHTSNSQAFLKAAVPDYNDDRFYVDELAVTDRKIITWATLGQRDTYEPPKLVGRDNQRIAHPIGAALQVAERKPFSQEAVAVV